MDLKRHKDEHTGLTLKGISCPESSSDSSKELLRASLAIGLPEQVVILRENIFKSLSEASLRYLPLFFLVFFAELNHQVRELRVRLHEALALPYHDFAHLENALAEVGVLIQTLQNFRVRRPSVVLCLFHSVDEGFSELGNRVDDLSRNFKVLGLYSNKQQLIDFIAIRQVLLGEEEDLIVLN